MEQTEQQTSCQMSGHNAHTNMEDEEYSNQAMDDASFQHEDEDVPMSEDEGYIRDLNIGAEKDEEFNQEDTADSVTENFENYTARDSVKAYLDHVKSIERDIDQKLDYEKLLGKNTRIHPFAGLMLNQKVLTGC